MKFAQLFKCIVGKHHRSKRAATHDADGVLRSKCEGCGRRMVKIHDRWTLA